MIGNNLRRSAIGIYTNCLRRPNPGDRWPPRPTSRLTGSSPISCKSSTTDLTEAFTFASEKRLGAV